MFVKLPGVHLATLLKSQAKDIEDHEFQNLYVNVQNIDFVEPHSVVGYCILHYRNKEVVVRVTPDTLYKLLTEDGLKPLISIDLPKLPADFQQ